MEPSHHPGTGPDGLTEAEVRRVARLARIRLTDAEVSAMQAQIEAVLNHVQVLAELDLSHTAPMAHPSDTTNKLGSDIVESSLPPSLVAGLAPNSAESFVAVPKVIGDDAGGA